MRRKGILAPGDPMDDFDYEIDVIRRDIALLYRKMREGDLIVWKSRFYEEDLSSNIEKVEAEFPTLRSRTNVISHIHFIFEHKTAIDVSEIFESTLMGCMLSLLDVQWARTNRNMHEFLAAVANLSKFHGRLSTYHLFCFYKSKRSQLSDRNTKNGKAKNVGLAELRAAILEILKRKNFPPKHETIDALMEDAIPETSQLLIDFAASFKSKYGKRLTYKLPKPDSPGNLIDCVKNWMADDEGFMAEMKFLLKPRSE